MKLYLIAYKIEGKWQLDGEWYVDEPGAKDQAETNKRAMGWDYLIVPVARPRKLLFLTTEVVT